MSKRFQNEKQNIFLVINEDCTLAEMTIENDNFPINEKDVLSLITKAKISYGFENAKEYIKEKNLVKEFSKPFPIAIGDSGSSNSTLKILFDRAKEFDIEKFREDFSVINFYERIVRGTPVATVNISSSNDCKNIFGEKIVEDKSVDLSSLIGKNVYYDEESKEIIAEKNGYPYQEDSGKINIVSEVEIEANQLEYLPEISFFGDLIINGNLENKKNIEVFGNLTINGDIDSVHLDVQGKITINGDVLNCMEHGVWATKNIEFNTAQNSRIVTRKSIEFKANCHFCRLIAEENVVGDHDDSQIFGGYTLGGNNIEVAVFGNSGHLNTDIEITIRPFIKEKMLILSKEVNKIKKDNIDSELLLSYEQDLMRLENELRDSFKGLKINQKTLPNRIICFKKIFPGVYLRILKKSKTILKVAESCNFTITNGELIQDKF